MTAFPVEGTASVRVEIQAGRIDVIATSRDDVVVDVRPSNPQRSGDRSAAESLKVHQVGGRVVVSGPSRFQPFGQSGAVDVLVEVPQGALVEAVNKYGPTHLVGELGAVLAEVAYGDLSVDSAERLEVKGGYGDFRVARVAGDADVAVKAASVDLRRVDGALRLTGSDGALAVGTVGGPAQVVTSSGTVELGSLGAGATVRSAYGAVRIHDAVRGAVRVDGSYGDVSVGVRRGTAVWLDASSRKGVVRSDLASDAGPAEGEETLELVVRTGYGSITLHRSDGPTA